MSRLTFTDLLCVALFLVVMGALGWALLLGYTGGY